MMMMMTTTLRQHSHQMSSEMMTTVAMPALEYQEAAFCIQQTEKAYQAVGD